MIGGENPFKAFGPIRVAFQDVDGCLNPNNGEEFPPGSSRPLSHEQLFMLQSLGCAMDESELETIVLNTGRSLADCLYLAKALNSKKLRFLLLEHSAYAYDLVQEKLIDLHGLAKAFDPDIADKYASTHHVVEIMDWFQQKGKDILEAKLDCRFTTLNKRANLSLECPSGLPVRNLLDALSTLIYETFPELHAQIQFVHSHRFVDLISMVHKSDGAKLICHLLAIAQEECVAIGDSFNDMDMFTAFSHALCPANAEDHLANLCSSEQKVHLTQAYGEASLYFYKCMTQALEKG